MKALLTSCWIFCLFLQGWTQTIIESTVPVYQQSDLMIGENCVWIPVNFDDSYLLQKIPDSLMGLTILKIDLVYTTFKLSADFDQQKLNQSRMEALKSNWPQTSDPLIVWHAIGQTAALDIESAKKMFHGFVLYYRQKPTPESMKKEVAFLDGFLDDSTKTETIAEAITAEPESSTRLVQVYDTEKIESPLDIATGVSDFTNLFDLKYDVNCYNFFGMHRTGSDLQIAGWVDSVRRLTGVTNHVLSKGGSETDKIKPCSIYWAVKKEPCTGIAMITHYYEPGLTADDEIVPDRVTDTSATVYNWMNNPEYNVVETVFSRNPGWTKSLVVMDVTGSMSPYIAKTMAWFKANQASDQIIGFVFFNDGNNMADIRKKSGSVGGIYMIANIGFNMVYKKMKDTMLKGGGGDTPENNIEATLAGIKEFPQAEEIIMIADNWATPRDMELVSQIDRPVHVVLCGVHAGVNLAYIQLAFDTGGSVHTIEQDLDAKGIRPGETLKIANTYFTLSNGKIVSAKRN